MIFLHHNIPLFKQQLAICLIYIYYNYRLAANMAHLFSRFVGCQSEQSPYVLQMQKAASLEKEHTLLCEF